MYHLICSVVSYYLHFRQAHITISLPSEHQFSWQEEFEATD